MKKLKRLHLWFKHSRLKVYRFLGNELYRKKANRYFKACGVVFNGTPKYINHDVDVDLLAPHLIEIGDGTVIAKGTIILVHDYSIECGLNAVGLQNPDYESQFLKPVKIGNNCFIGAKSFLCPGTIIGDNCIVGAGSVVRGHFESGVIISGNPAVVVGNTSEWAKQHYDKKDFTNGTKRKKK